MVFLKKVGSHFENISVSMRFILPVLMVLFSYNYSQDQNRLHAEMADIKDTGKQIWTSLDQNNRKVACMNQDIAKCCPTSTICY